MCSWPVRDPQVGKSQGLLGSSLAFCDSRRYFPSIFFICQFLFLFFPPRHSNLLRESNWTSSSSIWARPPCTAFAFHLLCEKGYAGSVPLPLASLPSPALPLMVLWPLSSLCFLLRAETTHFWVQRWMNLLNVLVLFYFFPVLNVQLVVNQSERKKE